MHIYAAHIFLGLTVSSEELRWKRLSKSNISLLLFWISIQRQQTLLEDQSATKQRERTTRLAEQPDDRESLTIYGSSSRDSK